MDQSSKPASSSAAPTDIKVNSSPLSSQMVKMEDLPSAPSASAPVPEASHQSSTLSDIRRRSRLIGLAASAAVVVLVLAIIGFYLSRGHGHTTPLTQKTLSDSDLQKLSVSNIGYDSSSQSLTFHSPVSFDKNLSVGGTTTIKDLTVTGTFTNNTPASSLQKELQVSGDTLLQGQVTAKGLLQVNGNLSVGGNSTFNGSASFAGALSANSISVKSATIGGLSFGHIATTGANPTGSLDVGNSNGNFQISGNDTNGTVVITIGNAAHTGDLVSVTFRTPYTSTPHVSLTPIGITSAGIQYYATRSVTGFTIGVINPVPGAQYEFDYLVEQ